MHESLYLVYVLILRHFVLQKSLLVHNLCESHYGAPEVGTHYQHFVFWWAQVTALDISCAFLSGKHSTV